MTLGQIKEATCAPTSCAEKFLVHLNETCARYNINTPVRQLCFLAQVGHESGGLFYTEELASGQAYEGRKTLGNTVPGDGVRFKGRGLIQITGRANYKSLGEAFGIDLLSNPKLLGGRNVKECNPEQLRYAALSAGWYWHTRKLNALADKIDIDDNIDDGANLEAYKEITRKINGGLNGLADRLNRYKNGQKYFSNVPVG